MRIGVDLRPYLDRPFSGVGVYTEQLLTALLRVAPEDEFVFFANGWRRTPRLPAAWYTARVTLRNRRLPNKLLNGLFALHVGPSTEHLLGDVDLFFAPNHLYLPRSRRVPMVLTVHDLAYRHFPALLTRRLRWWHAAVRPAALARDAAAVIAVSEATASDVQQELQIPRTRVHVVHSGIAYTPVTDADTAAIRRQHGLPAHYLCTLSSIEPRKNLLALLDAYTMLRREEGYAGGLVIAGAYGWSDRPFFLHLACHPFRHDIRVLRTVTETEKAALLKGADVFLFLSVFEGFGFPPLEALLQGTPVVAGHHSSITEVMGDCALLVDVHNVRDVVAATRAVLDHPDVRARLLAAAPALRARLHWDRAARATRAVFTDVIDHAYRR